MFVASTIAVAAFKTEAPIPPEEQVEGLVEAYQSMYRICCRPCFRKLALHLFSRSLPFIPAEVLAPGRLQDRGFPKESLANIKLVVTPLEIVMPWILSPFTAGEKPLTVMLIAYVPRALLTAIIGAFAYHMGDIPQPVPTWIWFVVFAFIVCQAVTSNAMFVAHMAFFCQS